MVIRLWNPIYGLADKNFNKSNIQKIIHISDFYVFFFKNKKQERRLTPFLFLTIDFV